MSKLIKYSIYLILFIILLFGALALLVLSIDPATLKPTLERELAKQGIKANFDGDIDWRFYPNIGLSVEALSLNPAASPETEQPLAYVDSAAFSVRLKPLLQRKILINGILVDSTKLNLVVDKNGTGNWESLGTETSEVEKTNTTEPAGESATPEIRIDKLTLSNLSLAYIDRQTDEQFTVDNFNVGATGFNLDGTPFPLSLSVNASMTELPPVSIEMESAIALDTGKKLVAISDARLGLDRADRSSEQLTVNFNSRINWNDPISITTSLNSAAFNLRQWLADFEIAEIPTQNPQALSKVAFAFDLNYSPDQVAVTNLKVGIDNTQLQGNTTLTALDQPTDQTKIPWHIESHWSGDRINLDDYLPPATDEPTEPVASEPQPLPLEIIRSLSAVVGLTFNEIIAMGTSAKDLDVKIRVADGIVNIEKMNAQAFDGSIATTGSLNAQQKSAALQLSLDVNNVNVGALAQHFADLDIITGQADTKVAVTSEGSTDQALIDNLAAVTTLSSDILKVAPFNLEQQYCKLLATLDKRELAKTDWEAFTELRPVTINARYSADQVTLEGLSAEIEKLSTKARGSLNLETGRFEFPIDISLADFSSGPEACGSISDKWRKHAIPLRCKGNLSDIGADVCLPDTDRMSAMVKAAAGEKIEAKKQELEQKVDTKVEEKKDEVESKAKSKLEKELERLKKRSGLTPEKSTPQKTTPEQTTPEQTTGSATGAAEPKTE